MQKFKIGDKVYHKSGRGPIMAIKGYDPEDSLDVTCQWFDKEHHLRENSFHQDILEYYKPITPIVVKRKSRNGY